jgi:tight adherence protein C
MTWGLAGAYVLAAWLLLAGLGARADRLVLLRAGAAVAAGLKRERRSVLAAIGRRLTTAGGQRQIERRLASAGAGERDVDRICGARIALAIAGGLAGLTAWPHGTTTSVLTGLILGAGGFRLPEFMLARAATRRQARMAAGVPDLLDLVSVSVTGRLTPRLALDRAAEVVGEPLGSELRRARDEVALGGAWRVVLRETASRIGLRDLRRLASTLERTERLGAPPASRLRALAHEVRAERRAAEEERARRAPVVMLFPLVFLILPAFVLAAVVPAILVATRGVT